MLKKLKNFILKNKKKLLFLTIIMVFFVSFFINFSGENNYFWINLVNAEDANPDTVDSSKEASSSVSSSEAEIVTGAIKWFNILAEIVSVFVAVFTYLITMFLSPEWVNGTFFGLSWFIKQIWILVSNIVYFIFAFLLIVIAFVNIVWIWENQKFQLKQALPRFVVWILIVPFSWFIVNFFISVTSALSIYALNLPYDTFKWYSDQMSGLEIPKKCTINLTSQAENEEWEWQAKNSDSTSQTNNEKNDSWIKCPTKEDWWETVTIWDLMSEENSTSGIFGTIWLYTYWILNLDSAAKLDKLDADTIKTILDLLIKVWFDFIFIILYAILMIALWLVLMTRWIRLWLYMMFSPVFWLMYFFEIKWWDKVWVTSFNIKDFISLAMVPVYSMLALSFWMLFIYIVWTWISSTWNISNNFVRLEQSWETNEESIIIWNAEEKEDNIQFVIKWNIASTSFGASEWGFLDMLREGSENGLWVIWWFIIKIIGLVVFWLAMIAAMKRNVLTKTIIAPLESFGSKVWEIASKSPQYLPIFPGRLSMWGIENIWNKTSSLLDTKSLETWKNFLERNKIFTDWWLEISSKSLEAMTKLNNEWLVKSTAEAYQKAIKSWKSVEDLANTADFRNLTKAILEKLDDKEAKELLEKWNFQNSNNLAKAMALIDNLSRYNTWWWTWWFDILTNSNYKGQIRNANADSINREEFGKNWWSSNSENNETDKSEDKKAKSEVETKLNATLNIWGQNINVQKNDKWKIVWIEKEKSEVDWLIEWLINKGKIKADKNGTLNKTRNEFEEILAKTWEFDKDSLEKIVDTIYNTTDKYSFK